MIRPTLVASALLAVMIAAPAAVAAEPGAATFHGTFSTGEALWSTSPSPTTPVFVIDPLEGVWNLNVAGESAVATLLVRSPVEPPRQDVSFRPKALEAHWTPGSIRLTAVEVPFATGSAALALYPGLTGVVNDPAADHYLYVAHLSMMPSSIVVFYDASTGYFFYGGIPDEGFACPPPSDAVPFCMDAPKVIGQAGR